MREMQFPLNNSGPARLADPQPLRLRKNKDSHMPENTHIPSAHVNVSKCKNKYTPSLHSSASIKDVVVIQSLYVAAHLKPSKQT